MTTKNLGGAPLGNQNRKLPPYLRRKGIGMVRLPQWKLEELQRIAQEHGNTVTNLVEFAITSTFDLSLEKWEARQKDLETSPMVRKFANQKGPWLYRGGQIDMYLLGGWCNAQNIKAGLGPGDPRRKHPTRNITVSDLDEFLLEFPKGLKEIN